eukprot:4902735-Lingulodinium_polyedra.AAC.1
MALVVGMAAKATANGAMLLVWKWQQHAWAIGKDGHDNDRGVRMFSVLVLLLRPSTLRGYTASTLIMHLTLQAP